MKRSLFRVRAGIALLIAACLMLIPLNSAWATPVGPGVPPRPAAPATPDPTLTVHPLATNAGPLINPLKGFAAFYDPNGDNPSSGFPRSLTWSYVGLSEVMSDPSNCSTLNWTVLENILNGIAATGNQAAIRFYIEYPGGTGTHPSVAIPPCFAGHVANRSYNGAWDTTSPDYDSPYLLSALTSFIAAYGAKYDGDPRIGFINLGLVGLWGEWHTYPYDTDTSGDSNPNYMPTDAHAAQIIQAYDTAFNKTKLEVRYADAAGGAANNLDIGYHDDSFCYREGSPLAGVTLPQSLGGASYAQLQRDLNEGVENKWITDSMGGEVRPEIQVSAFSHWPAGDGSTVDNIKACIELEHTTWKIDEGAQGYSATDPNVQAAVRLMGYNLGVTNSYFKNTVSGSATVGVQIQNTGVAPFYYPWTMSLGLKNSSGTVVKTWDTAWDLRTILPTKIRAYPNWNVGSDPTYLDYGYPQYFQQSVDLTGVAQGSYQLVMMVKNPLVSANAKKFLFANDAQNADGWLGLGAMTVGAGGGGDTTAPTAPTGLTSLSKTSSSVSLSWAASTDNVAVTGYRILRNGTQVGTSTSPTYTDTGLAASTAYTYMVTAYDGAGNVSAASSPLSVTTSAASSTSSYEAEAAGNVLTGTAVVAACATCSGGSKVGYVGNGATLKFTGVTGDTTSLQIYYSSAVARTGAVQINGGTASTVNFPATADWSTVGSISVAVTIPTGSTNTVTIGNATDWAPDIDRITTGGSTPPADTTAPSAPTGLTSPSATSSSVSLSWTASTDNVGVTGYRLFRNGAQVGTPTGTTYTDTGLAASTAYSYTVTATDAAGNLSAASSPLSVTTSATSTPDTTPPSAPNGLASPSKTSTSVSLTWNASTDNVAVTGYRVLRGGTQVGTVTSGSTYTDTGLTASTAYTYQVAAYDGVGNVSGASSSITVTTNAGSTPGSSYEAEASANTRTGTAVVASCAACSGGSKVGYVGNGATLKFTGVTGGTTTLRIYYSSAVVRTASLQINGGTATTVSFPPTVDWNTVSSVLVNVTIPSGSTNTVTLGNASDWAPDIDRVVTG